MHAYMNKLRDIEQEGENIPRDASVSSDCGDVLAYEMDLALDLCGVKMPVHEYAKA